MWRKLGDAGLLGIAADEEFDGLAMGYQAHCVVMEELSRASGFIGLSHAAHSQLCVNQLQLHGTAEQKRALLPGLIAGSSIGALAMSEAGAGSDVVSMRTTARRVDGGYLLNGSKMWITNGPDADVVIVYAKTRPEAGSRGITAFAVETKTARGFSCTRKLDKMGMRGSNTGELALDDVFVAADRVLGPVDGGVGVLMQGLNLERLVLSAGPVGLMQAALDAAALYVHGRQQFGRPVAHNQLVQGKLADMHTKLQASRAYTLATARAVDEGRSGSGPAPAASGWPWTVPAPSSTRRSGRRSALWTASSCWAAWATWRRCRRRGCCGMPSSTRSEPGRPRFAGWSSAELSTRSTRMPRRMPRRRSTEVGGKEGEGEKAPERLEGGREEAARPTRLVADGPGSVLPPHGGTRPSFRGGQAGRFTSGRRAWALGRSTGGRCTAPCLRRRLVLWDRGCGERGIRMGGFG